MKKIGIDMDDVLMDFGVNLFEFYNSRNGTNFTQADALHFELTKVWNCDPEKAIQTVADFYKTDLHHNASPLAGAVEFVKKQKNNGHELFVITARPEEHKEATTNWLTKHFPNLFSDIVFLNHSSGGATDPKKSKKKSEACRDLGIEIFIDDALHNVNDVATATVGIKTYLLDKPWNRNGELHSSVKRIFHFDEVIFE